MRTHLVPEWQWLYFDTCDQENAALYKIPWDGGEEVRITEGPGWNVQEAVDGALYYVATAEVGGHIHRISGGEDHAIAGLSAMEYNIDWALDAGGIYFLDRTHTPMEIRFFDFKSGKSKRIVQLGNPAPIWGGVALSTDRKWVLYSQSDDGSSDIMAAEGFR